MALPSCDVLRRREEYLSQDCALSSLSILDVRVGDSRSGSGLSALDVVHSSTTSCIRSCTYSEETQLTFLAEYVKCHVNSFK